MSELKTMAVAILILAIIGSVKFTSSTPSTAGQHLLPTARASIDIFSLTSNATKLPVVHYQAH